MEPDSHVFGALVVERRRTVIGRDTLVIAGLALLVSFFGVNCTRLLDRVRYAKVQQAGSDVGEQADLLIGGVGYRRLDVQANTFTVSHQDAVAMDQDAAGRSVVVWQSRRQENGTYGIFGRRFDAAGRPLTGEVHINAYTPNMQTRPAVSLDGSGAAWFAWQSFGQDGDGAAIVARKFDAALSTATAEVLVNTTFRGDQSGVALAAGTDGGAVIVWTSTDGAGAGRYVYARRFDGDATPSGDEFRVDSMDGLYNRLPCIGNRPDGGFTIVWARTKADGRAGTIFGRCFDASGAALGDEFRVSKPDGLMHVEPALAVSNDGSFVVAWLTAMKDNYVIHVQRFDANGVPSSTLRRIEPGVEGRTTGLAVATRGDGGYALGWSVFKNTDGDTDLFAGVYDRNGRATSATFRATGLSERDQQLRVASGAKRMHYSDDGRLAFAWSGFAGGEDQSGANLTLLTPSRLDVATLACRTLTGSLKTFGPIGAGALPHLPPTFDSDRVGPARRAVMALEPAGGGALGFLGIISTGWVPPDPHIAVGPDHVVLMTNGAIAFFEKDGTLTFQDQIENIFGFWGELGATNFVFDPEVIYDPHSNRFMAMANERTVPAGNGLSFFLLAVSDDSDPNGTWHKYRFDVTPLVGGSGSIDSPNIGVDAEAVYLTADFFGPTRYLVFILEKGPLLVGDAPATTNLLITGNQSFGIPVVHGDAPAMYLIEGLKNSSNTQVRIHAITDPLGTPQLDTVSVSTPLYRQPERPPQLGTSSLIITFEPRFWSCVYRNGSLWATHHVTRSAADPRVIQRWYQFDINGWPGQAGATPEIVQWGDIDPGPGIRTFFGSIAVNPLDNMAIVFARSSPNEFISIGRTGRQANDLPGTTRPMVRVKASASPEESERWGDYSGIVVDPVDDSTFWLHHEYRTSGWRTWVESFGDCVTDPCAVGCNDADVCTRDQCVDDVCSHTPNIYGDLDHDDTVNIFDLFCVLDGFSGGSCQCALEDVDIDPCDGNGIIDLFDLFAVLNAFAGVDPCCGGLP